MAICVTRTWSITLILESAERLDVVGRHHTGDKPATQALLHSSLTGPFDASNV